MEGDVNNGGEAAFIYQRIPPTTQALRHGESLVVEAADPDGTENLIRTQGTKILSEFS